MSTDWQSGGPFRFFFGRMTVSKNFRFTPALSAGLRGGVLPQGAGRTLQPDGRHVAGRGKNMKDPSGVSEFCTTNSLSACTAFLNDSLASLGYRPSLRPPKPAFDEKLTRPARPLAARQNCGEPLVETVEQPPSKGVDQGRVEEALAAALNVIYRLLRDVESTAERQNYSCAQISALRKQIHDDNREIRRIDHAALAREQQLRKRVAQLELELERSQAALRAALARAETLRVDNARLADEINVQAHRMRRLEIRQTKPRLQPRSVANVGAAKVVSPSGDQPLGSEAVGVGIQQATSMNSTEPRNRTRCCGRRCRWFKSSSRASCSRQTPQRIRSLRTRRRISPASATRATLLPLTGTCTPS
eukprot:ctg_135.g126